MREGGWTARKRTTSWANTKSKIHLTREPNTAAAAAAEPVADEGGAAAVAGEGQEQKKQQHLS